MVGAGPVGLTLAMDLAARGYAVTVVETRSAGEPPSVKCNHVSARSMEIFRRLGVAQKLRDAGLARRLSERLLLPHHGDRHRARRASRFPAGATATPPPAAPTPGGRRPSRRTASTRSTWSRSCSRMPRRMPGVTHPEPHARSTDFDAGRDDGVVATAPRPRYRRRRVAIARRYLVGCDGGTLAGAQGDRRRRCAGTPVIQRVQSTYIRAPQLLEPDAAASRPG